MLTCGFRALFAVYAQRQQFFAMSQPDSRNVEVKARMGSDENFNRCVEIAKKLCSSEGEVIKQHDVFFNVTNGRLKLRFLENTPSQLVSYSRPDTGGAKLSCFKILELTEPELLKTMLAESIGIKGEVKKIRTLFWHNHTRIHLDKVENLGNFFELEVCLRPEHTIEEGTKIANELVKIFKIEEKDLIAGAYMDLLLGK
ncbi:uncharacterized protein LOC132264544 [Phlebotomus argentipes]|uniref:uncharacterized protein LOC132264544 n=1 Tax=Phlebotomus argentipes TaxID=94469 RepID=UPI002892AA06|nr:uncharacterized protein LOC132264544 [Phlebotomus argentipes]